MGRLALDFLYFRRFRSLLKLFFPTTWLAFLVVVLSFLGEVTTYLVGILASEFFVALGNKDFPAFRILAAKATCYIIAKSLSFSLIKYMSAVLAIKCRQICSFTLHRLYFKRRAVYKLSFIGDVLDNPDQRMTQDVEKTTLILACELLGPVITVPAIILCYSYLTFDRYISIFNVVFSSGWMGPVTIYVYFLVVTIVNKFLISPIVGLVNEQERKEKEFRLRHTEVQSNVDSIAFYQSGLLGNVMANQKLKSYLKTQKRFINWRLALSFVNDVFDNFGGILSYLVIGFPIFFTRSYDDAPPAELSGINAFFYMYLLYSLTNLIALFDKLGSLAGVTHRVTELFDELRRFHNDCLELDRPPSTVPSRVVILGSEEDEKQAATRMIEELHGKQLSLERDSDDIEEAEYLLDQRGEEWSDDGVAITVDSVSLSTPSDQDNAIVTSLSVQLIQGQNVLLTGDSGTAKTALFRMVSGMWTPATGKVYRHWASRPHNMLFISQKPYFPSGATTLRQQIVYPVKAIPVTKDGPRLKAILESLKLDYLIERCQGSNTPVDWDWMKTLSSGELQRLSIARVLYTKPRIAFLDEATSAVGLEMEVQIYRLLQQEGITFVSIGHRFSLQQLHDFELHLYGHGNWSFNDIDATSFARHNSTMGTDCDVSIPL